MQVDIKIETSSPMVSSVLPGEQPFLTQTELAEKMDLKKLYCHPSGESDGARRSSFTVGTSSRWLGNKRIFCQGNSARRHQNF